jgi:hypothetical protein
LQRADAQRLHDLDDYLIFAARLINGQATSQSDFKPVLRLEAHQPVPLPVEDRAQLRMRVLQREIPVARLMPLIIRDLALHVQGEKFRLQRILDLFGRLDDRKHATLGEERGEQFRTGITHKKNFSVQEKEIQPRMKTNWRQ